MLFFSLASSSAFASWQLIAMFHDSFNNPLTVEASFFFNEARGFVGLETGLIKRTSDGGKTWYDCSVPFGYIGDMTDIFMKDSLNGWATIEDYQDNHGLWYTNDGGVSWHEQMNIVGAITSVYQTPFAVIFGDRYLGANSGMLSVSSNSGLNFGVNSFTRVNGLNFVDALHGVATIFRSGTVQYTSDGGVSWQKTLSIPVPMTTEAWGVYAQKGTSNFIIAGEKDGGDVTKPENVFASNDYGASWQVIGQLPGRTTGHIAGVGTVVYVQSWTRWQYPNDVSFVGMSRSTDGGASWKNVGGPANYRDKRFSVTGCLGGVVYAFDESGGVWKTTDGGDGDIHEPPHNPNLVPDHIDLAATLCKTATADLQYNNLSCNPLVIESVGFIDSTDPAVSSGALSFTRYPSLPQTLNPTSADFLTLNWVPKLMGVQKPLSTTYIKVHSTMLNGAIVLDTLIPVNSQSFANIPMFSLSVSKVKFDSLNICNRFVDTAVTFTNQSCDTLWLDSSQFGGSADWKMLDKLSLNPLLLPIGLAPGESASFAIRFIPSVLGAQKANLLLHFSHQGLTRDTLLTFSASCYRAFSIFGDKTVDLAQISICTTIDTVIYLHNPNCDTLTVDGITNSNSSVFSNTGSIVFPYLIPPDDSLAVHFRYNPLKNVASIGIVTFQCHLQEDSAIWESKLSGSGLPGTSAFVTSSPDANIIFTDRDACSPQDSFVFTITNPGCDSVKVLNSTLAAIGLPAINYRTEPPLPAILSQTGDKVRVIVYLQAQTPSSNDGTLKFSYELSDGSQHDSLFTIHALVSRGARIALLSQSNIDLGTGSLCNARDTSVIITNPGCPSLTINNISVTGNYFAPINLRPTPFDLASGESDTIYLSYIPTTSGNDIGNVQVMTNADINPIRNIPLTASTRQIDHIGFTLVQENSSLLAGDTAIFAFIPDNDWTGKGLQSIGFAINTNGNLLTYNGHTKQADNTFKATVTSVTLPGNQSQLNVLLNSPAEIALHKDQPLVYFYYATALTDTINTPVSLSLFEINNGDSHYANCILSTSSQDGDFTLDLECGSKTLVNFLKGELPILSDAPRPNPVTWQSNYQATLPFTASQTGLVEIDYYDVLGKCVGAETIGVDKPGIYTAHFDGSKISGGNYEYILRFRDGASNAVRGHIILLK